MLLKLYFYLFLFLSTSIYSVSYASAPQAAIPEFCAKNFPAINPNDLRAKVQSATDDQQCTLSTHDGLQIPVGVKDLLQSYTSIQNKQNQRVVSQFQATMRKKVAEGIGVSRRPYEGLYDLMNCERKTFGRSQRTYMDSDCEESQKFTPQCSDQGINQVLQKEETDYLAEKESHVDEVLGESAELAGVPIDHPEVKTTAARQEAEEALKKAKKFSFLKRNIETALLAKSLVAEKEELVNAEVAELSKFTGRCTNSRGRAITSASCTARKEVKEKYIKLEEERQYSLARMYEQYPTAFTLNNDWGVFDWFNYEIAPNDFAKELDKKLIEKHPQLARMSRPEHVKNFLNSADGKALIENFTKEIVENPVDSIETKGREATFAELRKKREAIEHICESDGADLHHFTGLAQEVLDESSTNPKDLIDKQAAYCYLVQTSPLEEGGFPTGALIGAGALVVAGVALQFIPGVGTAAGALAFAKGAGIAAGIAGGAIFSMDAVDRYQSSAAQDNDLKSIYHSANSWATSEELIASQDKRYTQAAFAAGEVALSAVDAAFIIRPAISLAVRLSSRVPSTAKIGSAAGGAEQAIVSGASRAATDIPVIRPQVSTTSIELVGSARQLEDAAILTARNAGEAGEAAIRNADEAGEVAVRNADEAGEAAGRKVDESAESVADTAIAAGRAVAETTEQTAEAAALAKRVEGLNVRALETKDVNEIYTRMSRGLMKDDLLLDDFASLFSHKGSYTSAFSASPRELSVKVYDALKKGNKEEALAILKASFEGKDSAASLRRLEKLNAMVENVYKAQQVGLTNSPSHKMLLDFRKTSTADRKSAVDAMTTRLATGEVLSNDDYLKIVLHSGAHMEAPMSQASHQLASGLKEAIEAGNRTEAHRLIDDYYKGSNLPDRGPIQLKQIVDGAVTSSRLRGYVARGKEFFQNNRRPILLTTGALFGASVLFTGNSDDDQEEDSQAEVQPEEEAALTMEDVKKRIKVQFKTGKELDIKLLDEFGEFTVEAVLDGEGELPADGKLTVVCTSETGGEDFCKKETGFKEDSGEQKVKLFKPPLEYSLTFKYVTADTSYVSDTLTTNIFRICTSEEGGGLAVDLCDPDSDRTPAEAGAEAEERTPFWWEDLEPNQPPPPFMPGPPLRMRSFMLPGFI